jgi:4-amino-4-deoxy-L-arabinose transferase-like glycosyltransferase
VLAVLGLTVLAAALRVWRLADIPPGFHVDEAFNVLDARHVLAGWRPVFLPDNAGREVLYTYLQAGLMAVLGDTLGVARMASALAGTATVLAAAWFAWQLRLARRAPVMVLTAAFTALSYWHLHFSRFGIRAALFPLVVTLVLGLWLRRTRPDAAGLAPARRDKVELGLLALLLGLAAYTHPAGRALALVPAVDAGWRAWRGDRQPLKVLGVAVAGAFVVALPLAVFWFQHPWLFTGHAEEVSVAQLGPAAVLANLVKVLGMFNIAGDPARWRNLPGRPVFDPLTGLFFLAGLLLALRALRRGADWALLVLAWLVVLVLPSVFSDAAPNFSRAIGALPVVCLLPALALDEAAAWGERRYGRWAAVAIAAVVVVHCGLHTGYDYFGRWARDPATPLAFDADKVAVARYLNDLTHTGQRPYTSFETAQHATVRAASLQVPRGFDAAHGLVLPPSDAWDAVYVFRSDEAAQYAVLNQFEPQIGIGSVTSPVVPAPCPAEMPCPSVELRVLTVPQVDARRWLGLRPDEAPDLARFGPNLALRDAWFPASVRRGDSTSVTLVWRVIQTPDRYLNTLVHLDATRPDGTTVGVANGDGPPLPRRDAAESSYPTDIWQPGETIIANYPVTIPADAPAGPADLLVGWYDPAAPGQRLPVDAVGPDKRENGTVFRVGTVTVTP